LQIFLKKSDVTLKFFKKIKKKNPRGSATWRFCHRQLPWCTFRGNPGKKNLQGRISTKFFPGDKPECAYFVGGKHLFTLDYIMCSFLSFVSYVMICWQKHEKQN
jgi:hypothetical protein